MCFAVVARGWATGGKQGKDGNGVVLGEEEVEGGLDVVEDIVMCGDISMLELVLSIFLVVWL